MCIRAYAYTGLFSKVGFKAKEGSTIDEEKVEKIFRLESQNTMDKFKELLVSLPMEHVQISAESSVMPKRSLTGLLTQMCISLLQTI